jgi:dihydrofolate reductase
MISLIAAVAENNCIGIKNDLPWDIPEDLKHFKEVTQGKPVLMGYNTYLSIVSRIGKPLPNRTNVVVSRESVQIPFENVIIYSDLQKALSDYKDKEVFVIGGASIYKQTIDVADKLYITKVHKIVDGDAFFPEINPQIWNLSKDDNRGVFSFQEYLKK